MVHRSRWLFVVFLVWTLWCSSAAAFEYTVQPGDTFRSLAQRFYDDPRQWQRITEANNFPEGSFIRPGQKILIPEEGDPDNPAAQVAWARGEVSLRPPNAAQWSDARPDAPLLWQHALRTGEGTASLRLRDGSRLLLAPHSELLMIGVVGSQAPPRVRLRLLQGQIELLGHSPDSTLEVLVESSLWTLRGGALTLARLGREVGVAVQQGEATGAGNTIPAGQGALASDKGENLRRRPLPGAPGFLGQGSQQTPLIVGLGDQALARLSWQAPAGAARYELRLWQGQGDQPLGRWETKQRQLQVPVPRSGLYRLEVRALSDEGLPGPWGQLRFFGLVARASREALDGPAGELHFMGTVSLELEGGGQGDNLVFARLGEGPPRLLRTSPRLEVAQVGRHTLWLSSAQEGSQLSASVVLEVLPIPHAEVSFSPQTLDPLAPPTLVQVQVALRDHQDQPVLGSLPTVSAGGRSCQAQPAEEPGVYGCSLRPRVAPGLESLPLVVEGQGGSFRVERSFSVKLPDAQKLQVR